MDFLPESGSPAVCVDHAARRTRRRSRSKLARPYICRLINLSRVICPSAWPLLQGVVSAARIAAPSCSSPAANVSRARTPHARASASQVVNATRAASGPTFGLTPHPRTRAVNRRASPATCAAVGSCSTRATRAASGPDSADGGWTSSQASCAGRQRGCAVLRSRHWRVGWRLGSPPVRGARGRGCPVLGHPALHLFCCPRKAGGVQLTPESQRVLAALGEPRLQVGEIRIQDAAPKRPPLGHGEALGRSVFAHGPDREVHRPADRL